MPAATRPTSRAVDRFLSGVEWAGNILPHPAVIFVLLAAATVIASAVARAVGLSAVHPGTGETVVPFSLLSTEGIHRILSDAVKNFTGFAPLGTVLVSMIGIGVAEASGLIGTALRLVVLASPRRLITAAVVFAGVVSNTAAEVGYVLLVPLAGAIFLAVGRHPVAGIAAAFAGVSGGYSANILLGTIDPLLAGLTQEAAHIVQAGYEVNPACNYYFMAVSTFLITLLGTLVTERIVEPRLGRYDGAETPEEIRPLTRDERRGLIYALLATVALAATLTAGLLPAGGVLRDPESPSLLDSPVMHAIPTLIFLGGVLLGLAYGVGARTMRRKGAMIDGMSKALGTMGGYLVLVFFAAQFVAYFNWSHLGLIFAVKGAEGLRASGLGDVPLLVGFVALSAGVNLLMGSASAKWAVMAPVFVPMFMLLGYTPELTQAAYRVGDSTTNIISPTMSYFPLVLSFLARYAGNSGLGTLISLMIPYSIVFFVGWTALLIAWVLLGLPVGPGAALFLPGH